MNTRAFALAFAAALLLSFPAPLLAGSKTWTKTGGDSGKAAYNAGCAVSATASTSAYKVTGNAYTDVAMLNSRYYRLAYAGAGVSGTKKSIAIDGRIEFAGGSIWNYSKSLNALSHSANAPVFNKTFRPPVSPTFMVGGVVPVTVTPSVSLSLSAGASAAYSTSSQTLTTSLRPATIDCSGGVTASVVKGLVRVNGNLTVCRVAPSISGACDFRNRIASHNAGINYATLGGSITLQAGWTYLSWTLPLMNWNGYTYNQSLLSESTRF